ncbi:MAG: cation:proton antiporter [Treponema sp. GWB1_62_6]|nr:MAG: cation:proton antiporter [Treponema sp. GWA1_62_8]OHE68293.1 MAG: cation:proton antiporter [Treponema sp. RIFOXYC1_FULL_61_9]OHE69339.1 MAG: cation:proton antiporter [Treponema sp. GWC1_61_84]OHE70726.1 MAG: cation:proton antiporter [Treponema sp. GWB1_62_6]HCM26247.1 cation:proton antiporter [Treponema sp.]
MADTVFIIATGIAAFALLLGSVRFAKGPWAIDRTVALDAMTIIATSLIAAFAVFSGRRIYVDVGMVYGLVGFVGVVAFARYLEGGL